MICKLNRNSKEKRGSFCAWPVLDWIDCFLIGSRVKMSDGYFFKPHLWGDCSGWISECHCLWKNNSWIRKTHSSGPKRTQSASLELNYCDESTNYLRAPLTGHASRVWSQICSACYNSFENGSGECFFSPRKAWTNIYS